MPRAWYKRYTSCLKAGIINIKNTKYQHKLSDKGMRNTVLLSIDISYVRSNVSCDCDESVVEKHYSCCDKSNHFTLAYTHLVNDRLIEQFQRLSACMEGCRLLLISTVLECGPLRHEWGNTVTYPKLRTCCSLKTTQKSSR